MNILEQMLGSQGGQLVESLSKEFGLDKKDTEKAVGGMLPSLTKSLQQNLQSEGSGSAILDQLNKSDHDRYLDDPTQLGRQESINAGNDVLGELFGGKAGSREVASQVAEATGIDISILKRMLPQLAGATMGGLKREATNSGALNEIQRGGQPSADVLGNLSKYLDMNNDGSIADDVMGMVAKFLR